MKQRIHFRLDPRAIEFLETIQPQKALPTLNSALNFVIMEYQSLSKGTR